MDPHTGRVLAIVGGFSFAESQFDRASQARRQPGSSFKPIVYATALDNGYTPSTVILDAPIEIESGPGQELWKPENYSGKFYGPSTLRTGIEYSRNLMTVRLAQDVGMPLIAEYARRFGIYDELFPVLSMALGAGETTLLRMTTAYATIANGGQQVTATLIDRIQDRHGTTIWRHDGRECTGCDAAEWSGQDEPELPENRRQIIDPHTAYQITSMMEGVVQRGTATTLKELGVPIAGKTGTTNDEKDAWFVGFTPDLVVGVYVGYDTPTAMGKSATGGHLAAPIVKEFLASALEGKVAVPFRIPPGIKLVRINRRSGARASSNDPDSIVEAFKPDTDPPEAFSLLGGAGGSWTGQTDGLSSGLGGLY
jgi:penicillin-binding protein 1A